MSRVSTYTRMHVLTTSSLRARCRPLQQQAADARRRLSAQLALTHLFSASYAPTRPPAMSGRASAIMIETPCLPFSFAHFTAPSDTPYPPVASAPVLPCRRILFCKRR